MNYIRRSIEDVVRRAAATFKAVLVTGARQTGKSTLLRRLFPDRRYVPLDDPYLEDQANDNPNLFMMLNPPPVIYDEVQRAPGLFRFVKIACDGGEDRGLFCLSGSQPLELMERASESLSGRVCILELPGLSLRELGGGACDLPFAPTEAYVLARGRDLRQPENIWTVIHRGSYPALQDPALDWMHFYSSYVKTYLERDLRSLAAVQHLDDFRRFMVAAAARTGQILNVSHIAAEIGRDQATVRRWLGILEATGIVYLLEPFASLALRRIIKAPKLYFRDTGLAAYLTRWLSPDTLAGGAMCGAFFETFAVNEIIKSYANRGIDYRYCVSWYRGRDKRRLRRNGSSLSVESEIDLIIEADGLLHPVEIKTSSRAADDDIVAFTVLDRLPDKRRGSGAVVCLCSQPGLLREDVWQIPVWYL